MWLLKLHIAISILCLLGTLGMTLAFKDRIKRFKSYRSSGKSIKRRTLKCFYFIFPVLNVLLFVTACVMVLCSDEYVEIINKAG